MDHIVRNQQSYARIRARPHRQRSTCTIPFVTYPNYTMVAHGNGSILYNRVFIPEHVRPRIFYLPVRRIDKGRPFVAGYQLRAKGGGIQLLIMRETQRANANGPLLPWQIFDKHTAIAGERFDRSEKYLSIALLPR